MALKDGFLKILLVKNVPLTELQFQRIKKRKFHYKHCGYLKKALKGSQKLPIWVNNEKKLAEWIYDNYGNGHWIAQTWQFRKCKDNKTRICFSKRKVFDIIIDKGYEEGMDSVSFRVVTTKNLSHYRFWKGRS